MAAGIADVTVLKYKQIPGGIGHPQFTKATLTFGTAYPTGGWPVAKAALGFPSGEILDIIPTGGTAAAGFNYEWDEDNSKLIAYVAATGAQVANADNAQSTLTLKLLAIGVQ